VVETKRRLISCYRSQIEYLRRYDHVAVGLAAWNSRYIVETKGRASPRYAEVFFTAPLDAYCELVERFYRRDLRMAFKDDRMVLNAVARLDQSCSAGGVTPTSKARQP
jgi:hypothetical protein